jgi:hypothetical protein
VGHYVLASCLNKRIYEGSGDSDVQLPDYLTGAASVNI